MAYAEYKKPKKHIIKYPIDDLLLDLAEDDQKLTERPSPCRDFNVPMDCVGDLLMVWDFCTSFGRLLHLSPFSLEDFESALCHKDSNVVLVVECHSALLRFLMKDNGNFSLCVQNRKRKPKVKPLIVVITTTAITPCVKENKTELSQCLNLVILLPDRTTMLFY